MPKYSIITCTYNSEKYIKKCINSVKEQTFKNFEHIFIDGESQDNTVKIIERYQRDNPQKIHIFTQKPWWISKAMNEWILKAKWEYIIHLHSDDSFYDKKVLQKVDAFLKKNYNLDRIYGKANVIEEDWETSIWIFPNRKILQWDSESWIGRKLLTYFNYIPHQAVFIKKDVFTNHGDFDETISSAMDPDMRLRIKDRTKWSFINEIVCNYMVRKNAQSSGKKNTKKNKKNWGKMMKKHSNYFEYYIIWLVNIIINKINKTKR